MPARQSRRLSGFQKQVLGLYRRCLRAAYEKNGEDSKLDAIHYVRTSFRHGAESVSRFDIKRIEYMMRKAEKQLKMMGGPDLHVRIGIVDREKGQAGRQAPVLQYGLQKREDARHG